MIYLRIGCYYVYEPAELAEIGPGVGFERRVVGWSLKGR